MALNQTIPITLTPGVPRPDFQAANYPELLAAICSDVSASLQAAVSFFLQVLTDPTTFVGNFIYNIPQRVFKAWDISSGKYVPITENVIGDLKTSIVGNDQIGGGWVILNGRMISAIPGISGGQQITLESLFGSGGSLPIVSAQNITGLPASGAFSGIPKVDVLPGDGVITALPIGATYDQGEVQALRNNTEILRDSTADVGGQLNSVQDKCSELLNALSSNNTPPLYALIFIGYP